MKINENKLKRQQVGKEKWRAKGGKGTLWYEMGVGKTYTAILIMSEFFKSKPDALIRIIVPSDVLRSQWLTELAKHFNKEHNIEVFTSNEVTLKHLISDCHLLIVDEIHEFGKGNKLKILEKQYFNYTFILGLTGTFINSDNSHYEIQKWCPIVDRIDEEEARKSKFVTTVIEYNLPIDLTTQERAKYAYYNEEIEKYKKIFQNDFLLATKCVKGLYAKEFRLKVAKLNGYDDSVNKFDLNKQKRMREVSPSKIYEYAIEFVSLVQQRMQLVYNATNKVQPVIELCKKYKVKTIIFSENTLFADRMYHDINFKIKEKSDLFDTNTEDTDVCDIYHSNIETKIEVINGKTTKVGKIRLKKRIIERFRSNVKRILVTTKSLERGMSIDDIRMLINVSSTSKQNQHNQRKGRINRIEEGYEDINVLMVNIYAKNTIEESWLRNKQKGSKTYIKYVTSVDNINHKFDKNNENV
jgi:superfamily II DNA or RNA helicase